jgi:hypothetical protein
VRRYAHEIVAYKLNQLMDLELVPVTVLRELDGRPGSLQIWMQAAIDRRQLTDYDRLDLLEGLEDEIMQARIFNALIADRDRSEEGYLLLPRESRLLLTDNTRAFSISNRIDDLIPEGCAIEADFELAMRGLDRGTLESEVGGYLSDAQIDALLSRRDIILEACAR